ncbi:glycosyltransferase family 20-domain-containing protein [Lipomyces oligophaga]|uniref:glycosyltransferase family 20-domain-containing protein n=1 Tax=Lipomyces oligophaga TaxID=45792 RepID=UPI0034CDFFA1
MGLLVVSLYLPHTIHFDIDDPVLIDKLTAAASTISVSESFAASYDAPTQAPSSIAPPPVSAPPVKDPKTPVPNFIQSLASRVASANNTPPASPPLSSDAKSFFFKGPFSSTSAPIPAEGGASSTSLPNLAGLANNDPTTTATNAVEFERKFRSLYNRSVQRARGPTSSPDIPLLPTLSPALERSNPFLNAPPADPTKSYSISETASPSFSTAPLPVPVPPSVPASVSAPTSNSTSNISTAARPVVTQPRSRANSPPPAKHLVQRRRNSNPWGPPSLKISARRPPPINVHSPVDPTTVFATIPWTVVKYDKGNGALRNAIARAEEEGIVSEISWIGTLGMPTDSLNDSTKESIEKVMVEEHQELPVYVSDATIEGHYTHYCKDILWPTFHYQIPDNPKSKAYEDHSWVHYLALNQAFADHIVAKYKSGDTVWVHDYHLLLVPGMVRDTIPDAKIGFFLHIAFPSSEVYRCLPTRKLLLKGMLGADLIGFQTDEYARHFRQTCQVVLGVPANRDGTISYGGRRVSVNSCAIGIDPPSLRKAGKSPEVIQWRKMLRERWPDKKMIVGRDKLDQFRGVAHKMRGYEKFLQDHPEYKEQAVFIQVCLTNIASQDLESEVSDIVTRINAYTHVVSEPPVVFLHQDISFDQYLALLYEADVFVVTSLREGMNLTCHEYVFCQSEEKQGPLILSEFTGSATVFGKNCLLVNPWDKVQVADAFYQALKMPREEREEKYRNLYEEVTTNTCAHWVRLFLHTLNKVYCGNQALPVAV